jgi:hypothetical protein
MSAEQLFWCLATTLAKWPNLSRTERIMFGERILGIQPRLVQPLSGA